MKEALFSSWIVFEKKTTTSLEFMKLKKSGGGGA